MKLDTSSYYPKSPLDDDDDEEERLESEVLEHALYPSEDDFDQTVAVEREMVESYVDEPDTPAEHAVTVVATGLSWLLVPLLMPVYGILLIFGLSILSYIPLGPKTVFTLLVAAVNVALPAVLVVLLKRMGIVQDLGLNGQKERLIPYIISILCMGATAILLATKGFPMWVVMFYAAGVAAGLVQMVINFWWKISAHAAGIAGVVALTIRMIHDAYPRPELFVWLLVVIGCAGLVGSARLWLHRHTLGQVLAGYAVGFCSVYFLTMI